MKRPSTYQIIGLFFLLLFSCQKELYFDKVPDTGAGENEWSFTDSQTDYRGTVDSATFNQAGGISTISIYGSSNDGIGKFFFTIHQNGEITEGSYPKSALQFNYHQGSTIFYAREEADPGNFGLEIQSLDSAHISGKFSGTVTGPGNQNRQITLGQFTASITSRNITQIPDGSGQVTFWAREGCGFNGTEPMGIRIENQVGSLTRYFDQEPVCGAPGTSSFILPAGEYTATTYCGADSFQVGITVISGICSPVEIGSCVPFEPDCRISEDTLYFPPQNILAVQRYYFNGSSQVEKIQRINLVNEQVLQEFRLAYTPARITVNESNYFDLDACGRVRAYYGYPVPGDPLSGNRIQIWYQYSPDGNLIKISYAGSASPGLITKETKISWVNGNISTVVVSDLISQRSTEYTFQYYENMPAIDFLAMVPDDLLLTLQSALSFGKENQNLIYKQYTRTTDNQGSVSSFETFFTRYNLDRNGRVNNLVISEHTPFFYHVGEHFFGYHCF